MRKIILMIVVFSTALYSIEIGSYFPKPTQQEIQQYYQDKANNPLRYGYNPLQVGNKWYYSGWYADIDGDHPIDQFCDREVHADSLINDIMHYYVTSNYTMEWFWEYNQGDSLMAYVSTQYPNPVYEDALHWLFVPEETFYPYWCSGLEITCIPYGLVDVFGQTVMAVLYSVNSNYSFWAEVFGPISHHFDFGAVYLDGCILGGIEYGTVPNSDDNMPAQIQAKLTCYPNPFDTTINLRLDSKQKQLAAISIYNTRGQLIRTWQVISPKTLSWDGNDAELRTIPTGIYFVKATTGKESIVKKILKIK